MRPQITICLIVLGISGTLRAQEGSDWPRFLGPLGTSVSTEKGIIAPWPEQGLRVVWHKQLGTGYGAYWVGPLPTSPSYEMLTRLFFYPTEGHNGYLDVINDLGLAGGATLLGYFVSYVRTSLALMKLDRFQAALYLTLLFRAFVADMSESHWFSVLSVDFVIMTLATTALTRSLLQARAQRSKTTVASAPHA